MKAKNGRPKATKTTKKKERRTEKGVISNSGSKKGNSFAGQKKKKGRSLCNPKGGKRELKERTSRPLAGEGISRGGRRWTGGNAKKKVTGLASKRARGEGGEKALLHGGRTSSVYEQKGN